MEFRSKDEQRKRSVHHRFKDVHQLLSWSWLRSPRSATKV